MSQLDNPDIFKAGLIVIGNEILSGRTSDANTPWIAEQLTQRGIYLAEVRIIPDVEQIIIDTVHALREKFDYVFTTGGIGPTHDDITSESIAKAFNLPLARDHEAFQLLEKYYGIENLTPPRAKMALIPQGATLIPNPVSAAPGFIVENVYVMAGVPRIMQAMLDHILDEIKAGKPIMSNTIACNLPESKIAEDLTALQNQYPTIDIGSYPHYRGGTLGLSLVLRGTDNDALDSATQDVVELVKKHGDMPRALSIRSKSKNSDNPG
ncbi:MAG: Molybdopterin binding motif, CinA N-terminal domain protein [Micavibrio sp.]|nr:Molybdopterin binding motif, CinA N-terminal domain protein [Micavibrio sp.]